MGVAAPKGMNHHRLGRLLSHSLPILLLVITSACAPDEPTLDDEPVSPEVAPLAAIGPPGSSQFTLVPRGSRWSYKADGSDQGTAWRAEASHDYDRWIDPWPEALGPLGYGESYLTTTLPFGPDPAHKPITAYFRRFVAMQLPAAKLYLRVMYDDGFVFYINGHEGGRASMPSGPVTASTRAFGHEANAEYVTFDISAQIPDLRLSGDNTLDFEVHQVDPASSDLVFDAELIAWSPGNYAGLGANEISDHDSWAFWDRGGNLGTAWQAPDFDDSQWSAAPAPLGFGETYLAGELLPGPITTYFRKDFYASEYTPLGLYFDVMYDDGFVAYLNGHEVARRAMPAGAVTASTLSLGHEANNAYERVPLSTTAVLPYLNRDALNTLAVEVHQVSTTSSDLVLDLALRFERVWSLLAPRAPGPLHGVWFFAPRFGLVVGDEGTLWRTEDGGAHFIPVAIGTFADLTAIHFAPDNAHGWVVGTEGTALRSSDGGLSFSAVDVDTTSAAPPTFHGVDFVSLSSGFIVGDTAVYHTADGGSSWTSHPVPDGGTFYDIDFVDDLHGWIGGWVFTAGDTRGAVYYTADGGLTWTRQWLAPNHNNIIYDVEAIDASTAWAVGQGSLSGVGEVLIHTSNGGATWSDAFGGTAAGLLAIDFVDPQFGWAVGVAGSITHTEDGGATWTVQENSRLFFKPWLEDVHFADRSFGWAVGAFAGLGDEHGRVMRTTSGGVGSTTSVPQ